MIILEDERRRLSRGIPPEWANSWGEDEFGLFVGVRFGEAEQRLRWIPAGKFMMGSPDTEEGRGEEEGPQHEQGLTEGFWLADTPCTQAMWMDVMGSNPSQFIGSPELPVERVTWDDMQRFLQTFSTHVSGIHVRLPTEAQWERACRADSDEPRYGLPNDIAWYSRNSGGKTHRVAQKLPNRWGLYDMLGNVWEWCEDGWGRYSDPLGARGPKRVVRGGGCYSSALVVRAAYRRWGDPGHRTDYLGFRFAIGKGGLRQESARKPMPEDQ